MGEITWTEAVFDPDQQDRDEGVCRCGNHDDCTLVVEEGRASVVHQGCGLPLWLEPEDIRAEFPVAVTVETCGNPGGWHGMQRCECGPTVTIEHVPER